MTNLPAKKTSNHWGKYKVYYLVGASFLLLLTFILLFNSQNNREIKRISRQLSQSENENSWPTPRSPGRRDPYRQEEAGDFILPSDEQRNRKLTGWERFYKTGFVRNLKLGLIRLNICPVSIRMEDNKNPSMLYFTVHPGAEKVI